MCKALKLGNLLPDTLHIKRQTLRFWNSFSFWKKRIQFCLTLVISVSYLPLTMVQSDLTKAIVVTGMTLELENPWHFLEAHFPNSSNAFAD
jgi:membrane-anchored glycerophosphoryl diester phosphodiesterase (GDPDase)